MWVDRTQFNVQSSLDWTTHTDIWSTDDPKTDHDWARADAIWNLRPGDTVALYPKAIYAGWQNHLRYAEVTLLGMERKQRDDTQCIDS